MQAAPLAERFSAFGTSHQVVLAALLAGAVVLVWVGRVNRGTDRGVLVGKLLAVAIMTFTVPLQILYFTPEYWSLERTLPLQLCDLAWMVAVVGLWTHRWWAVSLTYYWGLTLTTQAIITPDLAADFPDPVFILYWAMHSMVVWAAVYLTFGLGLTPTWRSYRAALVATGAWAVTVFLVNLSAGTNYGYLNAKPPSASILDLLGDWPWYVLAEIAIVTAVWALVTWPWVAVGQPGYGVGHPTGPSPCSSRRAPPLSRPTVLDDYCSLAARGRSVDGDGGAVGALPPEKESVVHARTTTIQADPAKIDAGIAPIRDHILPEVTGIEGCVGMSLLVDRESGRCIATTAWESEAALRDSAEKVRPLRDQATQGLGAGSSDVDTWEVAVVHRDHAIPDGACARVTWVRVADAGNAERMLDTYKMGVLPRLQELDGFCSSSLLIDRETGRGVGTVIFDSREQLENSRDSAAVIRERATTEMGATVTDVAEFEVAFAHLHVPEMA